MRIKQTILDLLAITIGSILVSASFVIFILPNNFLSGGVSGVAIITHHYISLSIALLMFLYNIPILIWAWKELRLRFIVYTIIAVIQQSVFLSIFTWMPAYTSDPLLASIFGGVIMGTGGGIIIRNYGSSGGSDVIAIVLRRRLNISVGTVSSITNAVVIGLAGIIFGPEPAMYTLVSMFVSGKTADVVLEGLNKKQTAMIICEDAEALKAVIISQLSRGVTIMKAMGGFDNQDKDVIFCVVNQFELAQLKEMVKENAPNAFMTISETSEVLGKFPEHSLLGNKK